MIGWRRTRLRVWHAFAAGDRFSVCGNREEDECSGFQPAAALRGPHLENGERGCIRCACELANLRERVRAGAAKVGAA